MESNDAAKLMSTLPGDDIRQIMWRYSDRFELQMVVQSSRQVARSVVARCVADGVRNSHEWNDRKHSILEAFDQAGLTQVFMDPQDGGFIDGPKNLALALVAFELSWVDGGAATSSLASNLGLSPIHEKGTDAQKRHYMKACTPPQPGEDREIMRAAFALTEPLPFIGVDTGVISGKATVADMDGDEPMLQIEKRGRFITNMGFADLVTAAVDTDDERLKTSCMVILEEGDEGLFDRGVPTQKLVHQLSSTRDPVFSLKVPASRIIGGYTVQDGVIVPNFSHAEVIEAVFRRTRVPVGLMSSAKLLSAVEPIIRYHRQRFRGNAAVQPGTPRFESGLQMKEDCLQRLVDVWAAGEAGTSLGFATCRLLDTYDEIEKEKERIFAEEGIKGRAQLKAFRKINKDALELLALRDQSEGERDDARMQELEADPLVQFALQDSLANVLCPAGKLWNTGAGANTMREAVSLMGGYGVTEDCPGFLGQKWMDMQLEATYEGPESVQRRQLSITMTSELFLAQFRQWIDGLRKIASTRPGTGACALARAMELWLWTLEHLQSAKDADGKALWNTNRHGVCYPMADALCWLISVYYQILDVMELAEKGEMNPVVAEGLEGSLNFFSDLAHTQVARAAGEAGRLCAELVYGYNAHPDWDGEGCFDAATLEDLESVMPGFGSQATDVVEGDGSHAAKAGPCAKSCKSGFVRLRAKMDVCLTGSRMAKDRAATAIGQLMIPEALDYPL